MKNTHIAIVFSVAITSLIMGLVVGFSLSPYYQQTMYDKQKMGLGDADRWVDLRYLDAMITHHMSAIELAKQALAQSEKPEITSLSKEIIEGEPKLISRLYELKQALYNSKSPAPLPIKVNLGNRDKTFDLRFLNALIAHHEEGIAMAKEIRSKTTRSEILDNADEVEVFLNNSLTMLREWRSRWFNIK